MTMDIEQIAGMNNKWECFLEKYYKNKLDIVLYGAGQGSDWVVRLLETKHIFPRLIVDKKQGGINITYLS